LEVNPMDKPTTGMAVEELLVSRATGTDRSEREFQTLFTSTFPGVASTVFFIVQDRAVAEEITQEAFVQLLVRWRRLRHYDRPDLWVRRVAVQRAQRERHRTWRRRELERTAAPVTFTEEPVGYDDEVLAAVAELAPKQRAIVVLFYYEDRPMEEIAELVGCSVSAGWSQLHTARKRLAARLSEEVTDDVR